MNALVDPDAKSIQPWLAELRPTLHDGLTPTQVLKRVEQFVYEKVPYDWDWNTWGVVDYLPTADEVVEMGREDCDGRAVVAASMLKNLGFKAELVTDYAHMWVKTDKGETMSPGKTQVVVATEKGLEIKLRGLLEIPKAWMFGVSIFPLMRELIVACVLWLMLIHRGGGKMYHMVTFAVFVGGLLLLRMGGQNYYKPNYWLEGLGLTLMESTMMVLILRNRKNKKALAKSTPTTPAVA